ncbi:MAG: YqeG family HAD IIIA-type phosphatase [Ruminococcaceae bacterium]|nr:YqeG family HAD IIIA-type phosphatase [Oscillospiraceae bacterium]
MPLLTPTHLFRNVTGITLRFLRTHGIRALVLDVDNTLTAHGSQTLSPEIAAWLRRMRAGGIRLMLASNNTEARVAPFARQLGLDYASFCCKPAPFWLAKAQRKWHLPRRAIALVGDQLFTDYLAGSLYGVRVLLVRPMYADVKPTIRLKRFLEKPFLLRYYKKGGKLL